jgi:protein tyrosine/serine phosphatase
MGNTKAPSGRRRFLLRVALPAALAVTAAWVSWDSGYCSIRDHFLPRRFVAVIPGQLYRSGWIDARLVEDVLRDHAIGLVVDLTAADDAVDSPERTAERAAVRHLGIDYRSCPLRGDGTGDVQEYAHAVAAIAHAQARGQPVLVHCAAGDKRSGGVVAAFLLLVDGVPADVAKGEIGRFSKRGVPSDTVLHYLDDHLAEIAERVRDEGCALAPRGASPLVLGG